MARYTTPPGICDTEPGHDFEDALTGINGYLSPAPPTWNSTTGERSSRKRLCRKHYVEQYKARWPEADLSKI